MNSGHRYSGEEDSGQCTDPCTLHSVQKNISEDQWEELEKSGWFSGGGPVQ